MNRDRVAEVYFGHAMSPEHQNLTRDRIHWMCGNVQGSDVLDIGCSQGIAAILLGREGLNVVGIDHELEAIEDARKALEDEDALTRKNVRFEYVEATTLPFEDASFDSILLGEILEHLVLPKRVIAEARRVLRDDGVIVISTPYGLHEYHDHKDPIYLQALEEMLQPHFAIRKAELLGPYAMMVVTPGAQRPGDLDKRLLEMAEARLATLDVQLSHERRRSAAAKASADELKQKLKTQAASLEAARSQEKKASAAWRSMKNSRRWRVSGAFAGALRSPSKLLKLPVTLIRAMRRKG
jgi:2-polyprenyl-3-methyl-5-hydroxy-6-metoxy-1,4-benzoquinol methylase